MEITEVGLTFSSSIKVIYLSSSSCWSVVFRLETDGQSMFLTVATHNARNSEAGVLAKIDSLG